MQGLPATHFWDCNGAACDATRLQPWNQYEYKYAPQYAPLDPSKYGGAAYGEKLWMTGAASDALAAMLGPDSDCCGADTAGGGGCGKCVLVRNPTATQAAWTAVIMKKNRCPPWSNGCDKVHLDIAVPGHDNLQYSTANVCGSSARSSTYITKAQSGMCGGQTPGACDCNTLPGATAAQRMLRDGCLLFRAWGWKTGIPTLEYKPVACPAGFVKVISNAVDKTGVVLAYRMLEELEQEASQVPIRWQHLPAASSLLLGVAVALAAAALACLSRRLRRSRGEARGWGPAQSEGGKPYEELMADLNQ